MARVPLVEAGQNATPYPFILILGQDYNERIMGDKLRDLGVSVQWNTELALLDSYEEERVPVARLLLNTTDRAFRLVVSDSRLAGSLRTKLLARIAAFVMSRERIQRIAFRVVSRTGIHYRKSSLSKSLEGLPDSAPCGGDRFRWLRLKFRTNGSVEDLFQKLDDTQSNLIVIGQPSSPRRSAGPRRLVSHPREFPLIPSMT